MRIAIVVAAAVLACASAASAQQAPQDRILRPGGVEIKCRITRQSYQAVTYTDAQGKAQTLKGSEIEGIAFADEPSSFQSAKNAMGEGKPDKAATRFEEAIKEIETKKLRDWNKAPVFLAWGGFLAERGDTVGALAMLKRLRTECGDTWWRPESYRKAYDIAGAKGVESQKTVLDEMKAEPEPLASEAKMGLANLAFARGEHGEALSGFQEVAGNSASPYAEAAKLGVFRCLKTMKKTSELDAYCQKLLADPSTSPALQQAAGSWSAGTLLEKAGKDRAKIRTALFAAVKAIAMGPPERKDEAEDYVAALRTAAKAYATFAAEATKPEQKQEYKARAEGYLTEIVRAYKGTPWAEAAQLELQTLGVQGN